MTVFLLTLAVVLVLFAGMSIGVLAGRKPIKGTCGGMAALGMDTECDICGGDPNKCEEEQERVASSPKPLAYDAMAEKD